MIVEEPQLNREDATAGGLLGSARWGYFQRRVLILAALAVVLDGLDNQLVGFIAPSLLAEWGLSKPDLVPLIGLGLLAMSIGTASAGVLGDRFGRRPTLIASVFLFGAATCASASAHSLTAFTCFRLLAALGLGGAMPNATAMLAEFTPTARRGAVVTLGIVCVPLGGLLGGLVAAAVLPAQGWRTLCVINGVVPMIAAGVFLLLLPESPAFLVARGKMAQANAILRRCGITSPVEVALESAEPVGSGFRFLFARGLAGDTIFLWGAFFSCLLAVYSVFSWAPTMLAAQGLSPVTASSGLAAFNFGGIAGALCGGLLLDRAGSRRITVGFAAAGTLLAMCGAVHPPLGNSGFVFVITLFALLGAAVNGAQTMLFAVAANVYLTATRASGVGAALGVGRLGAVLSAATGAMTLQWGSRFYFGSIMIAMLAASIFLLLLTRHIAPFAGRQHRARPV